MNKHFLFLIILPATPVMLSMTSDFHSSILSEDDYGMQTEERGKGLPALSAMLDGKTPYWESFNQWLCFPAFSVKITCMDAEYGGIVQVPTLQIVHDTHYYEISMDPEPQPNCEWITHRWRELIGGATSICAYAAPLQEYDGEIPTPDAKDGSVWIINGLKSNKGYWNFEASENWLMGD